MQRQLKWYIEENSLNSDGLDSKFWIQKENINLKINSKSYLPSLKSKTTISFYVPKSNFEWYLNTQKDTIIQNFDKKYSLWWTEVKQFKIYPQRNLNSTCEISNCK